MPDRDKITRGLQCIVDGTVRCESCGYSIDKHGHYSCQQESAKDAIAMLKKQEDLIERLEYALAVAQNNLNYYLNGND